jgi:hypothetical protein
MSKIFQYISNNYLIYKDEEDNTRRYKEDDVSEFSMQIYKAKFFDKLQTKLYNLLNEFLIKEERNDDKQNRFKIGSIMKTITFLDYKKPKIAKVSETQIIWEETLKESEKNDDKLIYQEKWFLDYFMPEKEKYIKNKSENDIQSNCIPNYVKCALKYINDDYEKEKAYINKKFHDKINFINYKYLITNNVEQIAKKDTGIQDMFKSRKINELKEVFQLFSLCPENLKVIQKIFKEYIKIDLDSLYNDKEISKDPKIFVPSLIKLKKEMDEFVDKCFKNNSDFINEENNEFSLLMNKDFYPKQIANYVDYCMRCGFKGKSEAEIEKKLSDIISLFKFINSKLTFKIFSEKQMSERLIKGSYLSIDAEKSFISKLRQDNGNTYVNKMSAMIKDLEESKKLFDDYKITRNNGFPNGIKFNVQIISQNAWHISKSYMEQIELTPLLKICKQDFQEYYLKRFGFSKLYWLLSLSKLEIQFIILEKKI